MDEVTKDLEGVFLFDLLTLKKFGDLGDALPDVLELGNFIVEIFFKTTDFVQGFFHVTVAILRLVLQVLNQFHQASPLCK